LAHWHGARQALDALTGLGEEDIRHALHQASGPRQHINIVNEAAFEMLTKRQIALLRAPCAP
jgi:hypothetical protein